MSVIKTLHLDQWIGVTLPKTVFIQNYRLGFTNAFIGLCVFSYIAYNIWASPEVRTLVVVPDGVIARWTDDGAFSATSRIERSSSMCNSAENHRYHYWYDSGKWKYENATCMELGYTDRTMKDSQTLFVPTYLVETRYDVKLSGAPPNGECTSTECSALGKCSNSEFFYAGSHLNGEGQCLCSCSSSRQAIMTGVGQIKIEFNVQPKLPDSSGNLKVKSPSEDNIWTVVRDARKRDINGKHSLESEYKRFAPGQDISLTVEDYLQIGDVTDNGQGHTLDDLNKLTRRNAKSDSDLPETTKRGQLKEYPHLRITGVDVLINVRYYNADDPDHLAPDLKPSTICYIDVMVSPAWQSRPVSEHFGESQTGEEDSRSRYFYGVTNVLMSLVTKFLLGTLSQIYYKAQCTLLSPYDLFTGQVCRALAGMFVYNQLLARQRNKCGMATSGLSSDHIASFASGGGVEKTPVDVIPLEKHTSDHVEGGAVKKVKTFENSLTKSTMQELLEDMFEEHETLDRNEIKLLRRVLIRLLDEEGDGAVSQKCFVEAVVNSDVCTLRDWADLFDIDRKPCILERMYDTTIFTRKELANSDLRSSEHEGHEHMHMHDMHTIMADETPQSLQPAMPSFEEMPQSSFEPPEPPEPAQEEPISSRYCVIGGPGPSSRAASSQ